MEVNNEKTLTAKDLKRKLYDSLRQKGLVDSLKSQLRNRLVSELQQTSMHPRAQDVPQDRSLLLQASNSLVVDHMRRNQFDYSLSIFVPESGMADDKILTTRDMLDLLHISPHSKLYKNVVKNIGNFDRKGFLWQLLHELASSQGMPSKECHVQTEPIGLGALSTLDEKLGCVDEMFSSKQEGHVKKSMMQAEERILSYQRQLEERCRTDMKLEMARFKELELSRMRMEEREKCRKEISDARRDLEYTYKLKSDALSEREKHATERLQKEQEIQEREVYAQRQSILDEIELSRKRDKDLQRDADAIKREKMLQDDRLKSLEQLLKKREKDVEREENSLEDRLQDEMNKYKAKAEARFLERVKQLEVLEKRTTEESARYVEEREKLKHVSKELEVKSQRLEQLERQLQDNKCELISLSKQNEVHMDRMREMVDYKSIKERNAALSTEVEYLKMRLAEEQFQKNQERQKQEDLVMKLTNQARQPSTVFISVQQELVRAREQIKQFEIEHHHRNMKQDSQLKQEVDRNEELKKIIEEQTLQIKEMNQENVDLREQLLQTENALRNEVYRKPKRPMQPSVGETGYHRGDMLSQEHYTSRQPSRLDGRDVSSCRVPSYSDYPFPSGANPLRSQLVVGAGDLLWDSFGIHAGPTSNQGEDDEVQDAKHRLKVLEAEAENVDAAYRNFQQRLVNPETALREPNYHTRLLQSDAPGVTSTVLGISPERLRVVQDARPLSSTPFKGFIEGRSKDRARQEYATTDGNQRDLHSPPTQDGYEMGHCVTPDVSTVHQDSPPMVDTRIPLLTVHDLQPELPVDYTDSLNQPVTKHEDKAPFVMVTEVVKSQPTELDAASSITEQQSVLPSEQKAASSLTERQPEAAQVILTPEEDEKHRQEREDRDWEEKRRKRDEERRRLEEEEFEQAQKELEDLRKREEETKRKKLEKESETCKEETKELEKDKDIAASKKMEDVGSESTDIDPVMQKYMSMVKQQKDNETKVAQSAIGLWKKGKQPSQVDLPHMESDPDISVDDSLKSIEVESAGEDFW